MTLGPRAQTWLATLLFAALTTFMTWPQAAHLVTHAHGHYDVYFNMWRLAWIAHALTTAPSRLFAGNIFFPEPRTLTYSDAMLVEGAIGTPLLIAGVPPVLTHNLLLLGAIVSSATGIFVLARHLTRSAAAGVIAGVIFAFVPYRFEHFMHMELQWTMWMPWALWSLHRTFETERWKYGALTGMFLSLQMLSSIYYGVFLAILLGLIAGLLLLPRVWTPLTTLRALFPALSIGAVVAILCCGLYALPYLATKDKVGGRVPAEMNQYSARPSSYLVATPGSILYGKAFAGRSRPERRLFPGTLAVILAIVGLFRKEASPIPIAYLLSMVAAFELSLGLTGYSFAFLLTHFSAFEGFRALARLGVFVVLFLAVLAAYGYSALMENRGSLTRRIVFVAVTAVLLMEYRVQPMPLDAYPNSAPQLYAWLAQQPRGVVAEFPMPRLDGWPGPDARVSYLSTFHWQPMLNGYSGFMPPSYATRLDAVMYFPDERALNRLRRDRVRYLIVHTDAYRTDEVVVILDALKNRYGFPELGRFSDGSGEAVVFEAR